MVFVRFSSSLFICELLFSNDLLCSSWKGKTRKCASSHHRRRHPWGVSSRERPRRLMKRSRSPVDEDFVDEGRPTFKLSRGTSKFVLHRNRAFWRYDNRRGHGDLSFERGSVWKTSTIDSRESQFRSSHRYARQSGEHFVGQFKSELFVEYKTRWRVGQLWAPAEGLTTSPPRTSCSCSVDGQFNELWSGLFLLYAGVIYTCTLLMWVLDYVIN